MKNKLSAAFVFVLLLCMCGCGNTAENNYDENWTVESVSHFYYDYEIKDNQGNIMLSEDGLRREPHIETVDVNVVKVWVQKGTGLSTRITQYCDIENGIVSEDFISVLYEYDGKTVYHDFRDNEHYVVIQDFFDKAVFYKEFKLENVADCAADAVLSAEVSKTGKKLTVTYLTGAEYTESETVINIE
ncbi:MAG: hypothetical protein IJZ35_00355 [Clostridia bacterium]|nr:hypothetical protein [Clostridia bacterium]